MRHNFLSTRANRGSFLLLVIIPFLCTTAKAQVWLRALVIFGGNSACPTAATAAPTRGCGVSRSSSAVMGSGSIGTYGLLKTSSGVRIAGSIHSGATAELGNENRVAGIITVANTARVSGAALFAGNNSILSS